MTTTPTIDTLIGDMVLAFAFTDAKARAASQKALRRHVEGMHKLLVEARDHLNYCNYGDNWERERARDARLPERLDAACDTPQLTTQATS